MHQRTPQSMWLLEEQFLAEESTFFHFDLFDTHKKKELKDKKLKTHRDGIDGVSVTVFVSLPDVDMEGVCYIDTESS